MKQLLIFLFMFQVNFVFAAANTSDAFKRKGLPLGGEGIGTIQKIKSQFELGNQDKFKSMVERVCLELIDVKTEKSYPVGTKIESIILSYNDWTRGTVDYKNKIESFWEVNQNDFICPKIEHYPKKHLLKMIFDMQVYTPVLNDFFLKKSFGYKLNMNAYEMINGKPETIVDYLEDIISGKNSFQNYEINEVKSLLRKLKKHFKAKSGKQLLKHGLIIRDTNM